LLVVKTAKPRRSSTEVATFSSAAVSFAALIVNVKYVLSLVVPQEHWPELESST